VSQQGAFRGSVCIDFENDVGLHIDEQQLGLEEKGLIESPNRDLKPPPSITNKLKKHSLILLAITLNITTTVD
jgi:hypothetical protein